MIEEPRLIIFWITYAVKLMDLHHLYKAKGVKMTWLRLYKKAYFLID